MVYSSMCRQGERVMKILIQSKYNLLTSGKTYTLIPIINRLSDQDFFVETRPNPLPCWYRA